MNEPLPRKSVVAGSTESDGQAGAGDTVLIHGVSEDGQSLAVLRQREGQLEAGVVRKMKDGEPITGELVRLTPRAESPLLCDVQVEYASPPVRQRELTDKRGPAQVATRSYRQNWDTIFRGVAAVEPVDKKSAPN